MGMRMGMEMAMRWETFSLLSFISDHVITKRRGRNSWQQINLHRPVSNNAQTSHKHATHQAPSASKHDLYVDVYRNNKVMVMMICHLENKLIKDCIDGFIDIHMYY